MDLLYLVPFLLLSAILFFLLHSLAVIFKLKLPLSRPAHSNNATLASSNNNITNTQSTQSKKASGNSKRSNNKRSTMNNRRKNNTNSKAAPPAANAAISSEAKQSISSPASSVAEMLIEDARVRQPFEAFLVVDFEATCVPGGGFDYPNEIIEFPIVLLEWDDMDSRLQDRKASRLTKAAEFRSYVRPTWRTQLSSFCTALTGINQTDVDSAPNFATVLQRFEEFLAQHNLIDPLTGEHLKKFVFASDGPFDVRDFVVKQCYIANIPVPEYFQQDVLDVRKAVSYYAANRDTGRPMSSTTTTPPKNVKRFSHNIDMQLKTMGLESFEGRQHCGIDDARNIARILTALAATPMRLEPNTFIHPNRRWWWMVRDGSGRVDFPEEDTFGYGLGLGLMGGNGDRPPAYSTTSPPSYYSPPPTSHVVLSSPAPLNSQPIKMKLSSERQGGHSHSNSWSSVGSMSMASSSTKTSTSALPSVASSESLASLAPGFVHYTQHQSNPSHMTRTRTNSSSSSASSGTQASSLKSGRGFEMDASVVETLGSLGLWMPAPKSPSLTLRRSTSSVEREKMGNEKKSAVGALPTMLKTTGTGAQAIAVAVVA